MQNFKYYFLWDPKSILSGFINPTLAVCRYMYNSIFRETLLLLTIIYSMFLDDTYKQYKYDIQDYPVNSQQYHKTCDHKSQYYIYDVESLRAPNTFQMIQCSTGRFFHEITWCMSHLFCTCSHSSQVVVIGPPPQPLIASTAGVIVRVTALVVYHQQLTRKPAKERW